MTDLLLWAMIITVWDAVRILSSSIEYLSVCLYNSSIITGGSRDSKWKNGGGRPKTPSGILEDRIHAVRIICWTTPPNLLVKSRMDSSSRLKMVCRELMFPFCRTEHRCWETNAAHNSLNELIDPYESLWNQARGWPLQAG